MNSIPETVTAVPQVSVVLPCLDEERYIRRTLESLLTGSADAPPMEVLVVDGRSHDRTRAIVTEVATKDARVRLLDNPRGVTPVALNIGIRAARGNVIIRVDSHSTYPPGFVATLARTLAETGADMVGAACEAVPFDDSVVGRAIAWAADSAFSTGSRFRYRRVSGPVDAVQLGCWRRELFDRVGLFDERLLRNQDNEHSSRILAAGGRVWMTAEVCIKYHPRASFALLWKQARVTGMWNAFTQRLFPYTMRMRHILPGLFFLGVVGAAMLIGFGLVADPRLAWVGGIGLAPYVAANAFFSVRTALARGHVEFAPLLAFIFFSYHFSYGYGIVKGWLLVATGGWRSRLGGGAREARLK